MFVYHVWHIQFHIRDTLVDVDISYLFSCFNLSDQFIHLVLFMCLQCFTISHCLYFYSLYEKGIYIIHVSCLFKFHCLSTTKILTLINLLAFYFSLPYGGKWWTKVLTLVGLYRPLLWSATPSQNASIKLLAEAPIHRPHLYFLQARFFFCLLNEYCMCKITTVFCVVNISSFLHVKMIPLTSK